MAVLRYPINTNNSIDYVATVAFFCCVSGVTLMLKFGGFKASLNLFSGKQKSSDKYRETDANLSVTGAYRTNRDEFFRTGSVSGPPRKLVPSMVKLPTTEHVEPAATIRSVKSTGNLNTVHESSSPIKAAPTISFDPRGEESNLRHENIKDRTNVEKEQKRLDKQKVSQEKAKQKQEIQEKAKQKQEAQEQAKQEKLRKDREKKEAQQAKKLKKKKAPLPQPIQSAPTPIQSQSSTPIGQAPVRYSTNTLESSISRSSGPPPYSEIPNEQQSTSNNIIFSKPIDTGSWDMISKHRQQIDRPAHSGALKEKRMVMDLNYNFNSNLSIHDDKQNSDA